MKLSRFLFVSLLLLSTTAQAELVVIVNTANTDSIDKSTLTNIFLGKTKSFPNGGKAIPVVLDYSVASMETFLSQTLNKTASQYRAFWAKQVFSGVATPPQTFKTSQEIVELVGRNPDLIGVVDASEIDVSKNKVRVVLK
jgi:ABC-type phosphate transport system substrate-binding protein